VTRVTDLERGTVYTFNQMDGKLVVSGLPEEVDTGMPVVLKFETEDQPCIYKTGGHRNPTVPHCRYDPLPSELVV